VSFDELVHEVYPGLYRYCLRLTADPDLAEDATQEAFVRLLDRRIEGEPKGLRSWLFKVATHVIRDRGRIEGNRARLLETYPPRPSPAEGPEERAERKEREAMVRHALEGLSDRDRDLLLLREEGFSYRELAETVGVEPTSVGTLLARARSRFLGALKPSVERA
jgi:RNA polymerase sigma-70 factor (ECF subfamily)